MTSLGPTDLLTAARLFHAISQPLRLQLLLAIAEGKSDAERLATALGVESRFSIAVHLRALCDSFAVKHHKEGPKHLYSLTATGSMLVEACRLVIQGPVSPTGDLRPEKAKSVPAGQNAGTGHADVRPPVSRCVEAVTLLRNGSHLSRLRLLLALAETEQSVEELAGGDEVSQSLYSQVARLRKDSLVTPARRGERKVLVLTEAGTRLVQLAKELGHNLPVLPKPSADPDADMLSAPAWLLKAFAEPRRLRLLNLLAGREVCQCHLHPALQVPRTIVPTILSPLEKAGLVIGCTQGSWTYYRLGIHSSELYRSLICCAGDLISEVALFRDDRRRLDQLPACVQ